MELVDKQKASMSKLPNGSMGLVPSPRFSCVIPAFNRQKTIARAIESALNQTWAPDEIIVVDDGSTDETAEIVARFGSHVQYLRQENAGAAAARNTGMRAARQDWVALLDSDDYWLPQHLEKIAEAIVHTQGEAILYFANIERPETENSVTQWERAKFEIDQDFELKASAAEWVIRARIPMMLQASVFDRKRFLAKGGLWEALPMRDDTHAFLSMGISEPICAVAHMGVRMTADDHSGGRLTTAVGNKTRKYWELSTLMWRDLLKRGKQLSPEQRSTLRDRLTVSHLRVGRHAWTNREYAVLLRSIWFAFWSSPTRLILSGMRFLGLRVGSRPTG